MPSFPRLVSYYVYKVTSIQNTKPLQLLLLFFRLEVLGRWRGAGVGGEEEEWLQLEEEQEAWGRMTQWSSTSFEGDNSSQKLGAGGAEERKSSRWKINEDVIFDSVFISGLSLRFLRLSSASSLPLFFFITLILYVSKFLSGCFKSEVSEFIQFCSV